MNFDFSEEQKLLQKTTRDYLDEHAPLAVCRQVLESDASYSAELWKGAAAALSAQPVRAICVYGPHVSLSSNPRS